MKIMTTTVRACFFVVLLFMLLVSVDMNTVSAQEEPEFLLGPGDILEISVWKDEELTKPVVVRPGGKISFPLIGDVQASGRTVSELRAEVEKKIRTYVPDAPVSILVQEINSTRVYVVGKVNQPGTFLMPGQMTVIQALAMAGGVNSFADTNDILILRVENGKQQAMKFDYGKVEGGKNLDLNIFLKPGDTIIVP